MPSNDEELIAEQIRYYDDRAPIYEQLYFRQGRYAVEDEAWTANWVRETGELERFVQALPTDGSVLELACGNGLWTRFLAPRALTMVALDASARMLERNRLWVGNGRVRYVRADVFDWDTDERFDLVFLGFFLSHVPPRRWAAFWDRAKSWLTPGGAIGYVDDCGAPGRPAPTDRVEAGPEHAHIRRLDGDTYTIVKRFFGPSELIEALAGSGLSASVSSTGAHFLFGTARPL